MHQPEPLLVGGFMSSFGSLNRYSGVVIFVSFNLLGNCLLVQSYGLVFLFRKASAFEFSAVKVQDCWSRDYLRVFRFTLAGIPLNFSAYGRFIYSDPVCYIRIAPEFSQ